MRSSILLSAILIAYSINSKLKVPSDIIFFYGIVTLIAIFMDIVDFIRRK